MINEILDKCSKKDAVEVLKMVSAINDCHLVSNFAPVTRVPVGQSTRGGGSGSGRGRGKASSAPQRNPQKKVLDQTLEKIKDQIREEVKKNGNQALKPDHSLVLERDEILARLYELKHGSSHFGNEDDTESSKKKSSSTSSKGKKEEGKAPGSNHSPSPPKGSEEGSGQTF
jgi:hypothetical protein